MPSTLLQLCTTFAKRTGLPTATSVSTSTSYGQLAALLEEILDDLVSEYNLEGLTAETTFPANGSSDQGPVEVLAPGFSRLLAKTFFNRTRRIEVPGPLTATEFQALQTINHNGPVSWFRFRSGRLLLDPIPALGEVFAFEYISKNAVIDGTSGVLKQYPSKDGDTFKLPDELLVAGLRWKWKAEKGLDYAEEFTAYQTLAKTHASGANAHRAYTLHGGEPSARPGVIVPAGTWITPS